jgi:hypothetical protein
MVASIFLKQGKAFDEATLKTDVSHRKPENNQKNP